MRVAFLPPNSQGKRQGSGVFVARIILIELEVDRALGLCEKFSTVSALVYYGINSLRSALLRISSYHHVDALQMVRFESPAECREPGDAWRVQLVLRQGGIVTLT